MASKKDTEYTDEQAMQKTQKGPPKYRTSQPIGLNDRGEPFYGVSYKPEFKETSVQKSSDSYNAGAGRGKQSGPTADELDTARYRNYRQAMQAEYDSRAKMLGKTTEQYVKDQAAKERDALKKAPIEDFLKIGRAHV